MRGLIFNCKLTLSIYTLYFQLHFILLMTRMGGIGSLCPGTYACSVTRTHCAILAGFDLVIHSNQPTSNFSIYQKNYICAFFHKVENVGALESLLPLCKFLISSHLSFSYISRSGEGSTSIRINSSAPLWKFFLKIIDKLLIVAYLKIG